MTELSCRPENRTDFVVVHFRLCFVRFGPEPSTLYPPLVYRPCCFTIPLRRISYHVYTLVGPPSFAFHPSTKTYSVARCVTMMRLGPWWLLFETTTFRDVPIDSYGWGSAVIVVVAFGSPKTSQKSVEISALWGIDHGCVGEGAAFVSNIVNVIINDCCHRALVVNS